MKSKIFGIFFIFFYCNLGIASAQIKINDDILNKRWSAKWITSPSISGKEYGVYLFRKEFAITSNSHPFIIHVSADNRYKLYVNGIKVCSGPARGDLLKWYFESVDISSYLKSGKNIIAAEVWNFSDLRPAAQFSNATGFILQGNSKSEEFINTDSSWAVSKDTAYTPVVAYFYIIGPGEKFNTKFHPWNWMQEDFNTSTWSKAKELEFGTPVKCLGPFGAAPNYILYPRNIPLMEEKIQRFASVRRSNMINISDSFLRNKKHLIIPANSKVNILIDQKYLTNAYPVLVFSKGKESEVKMTYAEALYDKNHEKGNRDEVNDKTIEGYQDVIVADGGNNRTFTSLWFRPFRYVQLDIETKSDALTICDFYSVFTGYPLEEKASFKCDDPIMTNIWNVGWRTQRLCAFETFFDCPYYEQLQYVGDARIQSFVSTYVSGDSRLARNAISAIHESRLPSGITQCRYPSYSPQIIPPFSLIWNTMVYDYWVLHEDKNFIKPMIPGMLEVVNWFENKIDTTGLIGKVEWWNFVDWVSAKNWDAGAPPGQFDGKSAIINLQFVYTLQKTAKLLEAFNMEKQASYYLRLADRMKTTIFSSCWDDKKNMLADSPDKNNFSQHANALGILTNTIPIKYQQKVANSILENKEIAQASLYFMFYITEAIEKSGLAERYMDMLEPWKKMLHNGLSTFAEVPDPTRSDCHAWSASPIYYFLSLVCGIKPAEPGFKSVIISPNLGKLHWLEASMPHSLGMIKVSFNQNINKHITGTIILPKGLNGTFIANGEKKVLKSGLNRI